MSELDFLTKEIQKWYLNNKRQLPWRDTKDPYKIWLSEIILQQTQVVQGLPYYEKFVSKYPEVQDLAQAPEDQLLRDWQGLGYYSRARNLHHSAKYISADLNGDFPRSYNEIIKLKGVGAYTAAAIASFAFKESKAVVDGNVIRVISRLFAVEEPVDQSLGQKKIQVLATEIIDSKNPDIHNQAMMELGAMICTPKSPKCDICPLNNNCDAFSQSRQNVFPVKTKKIKSRDRYFNYLVLIAQDKISLKKREGKDIWQNLYDFPVLEYEKDVEEKYLLQDKSIGELIKRGFSIEKITPYQKHLLSHQRIWAKFLILQSNQVNDIEITDLFESASFFTYEESKDLGKPILIVNFLKKYIY